MSWDDAVTYCAGLGNDIQIASVYSRNENQQMFNLLAGLDGGFHQQTRAWLGGFHQGDNPLDGSQYVWSNENGNNAVCYQNWMSGEPNDYAGVERCMGWNDGPYWNDHKCTIALRTICAYRCTA